jgi:hypothetical protein
VLKSNHVVDDHLKIGRVCYIPAARTADYGVKAGQRSGERLDSVLCGFIVWIASARKLCELGKFEAVQYR